MSRKAIFYSLPGLAITVLFFSTLLALSPLWFTVLMIRPNLAGPINDAITGRIMHEMTKKMFAAASKIPG